MKLIERLPDLADLAKKCKSYKKFSKILTEGIDDRVLSLKEGITLIINEPFEFKDGRLSDNVGHSLHRKGIKITYDLFGLDTFDLENQVINYIKNNEIILKNFYKEAKSKK